jgi:tripartite motif-containing protein 71
LNLIETSYNQPNLSPSACWNPYAITFANRVELGFDPSIIFVSRDNTVYIIDEVNQAVHVWRQGSNHTMKTNFKTKFTVVGLFVTIGGDIFVGSSNGSVEKWTVNATEGVLVTTFWSGCDGFFIDIKNNLYCSLRNQHRVARQTLDVHANTSITVAGNGKAGETSLNLRYPQGIFVNINLDLYVADCGNNRVQVFRNGQNKGETVAGKFKQFRIILQCPTGVFLDKNNNLFIVDRFNHRIIRSSSRGFDCVIGCSGVRGAASHRLYNPVGIAFDNLGNIFVADKGNDRIQKFLLMRNIFGK